MKSQVIGLKVAGALFLCMALGHVLRLVKGWKVQVGGFDAPAWASVVAVLVAGALGVWLWTLACQGGAPASPPPSPKA